LTHEKVVFIGYVGSGQPHNQLPAIRLKQKSGIPKTPGQAKRNIKTPSTSPACPVQVKAKATSRISAKLDNMQRHT